MDSICTDVWNDNYLHIISPHRQNAYSIIVHSFTSTRTRESDFLREILKQARIPRTILTIMLY